MRKDIVVVSSKYEITLPIAIREAVGISAGSQVLIHAFVDGLAIAIPKPEKSNLKRN